MRKAYLILVLVRGDGMRKIQPITADVVEGNVWRPYAVGMAGSNFLIYHFLFSHIPIILPRQPQEFSIPLLLLARREHRLSHLRSKSLLLERLNRISLHLVKECLVVNLNIDLHVSVEDGPQELSANTVSIDELFILMWHSLG